MSKIPLPVARFETSLSSSLGIGDVEMALVTLKAKSGELTDNYYYGFTIDEGTDAEEDVLGTVDLANLKVVSLIRGVSPLDGETSVSELKFQHGRGASVKITNSPVLLVVARMMNGNVSIPNKLSYVAGITPTADDDIPNKKYVDDIGSGGTLSVDSVKVAGTAGETLASGAYVYLKDTDGKWYNVDANDKATINAKQKGFAQSSGSTNIAIAGGVLISGLEKTGTYTAGTKYYASDTPGAVSSTPGTNKYLAGVGDVDGDLVVVSGIIERKVTTATSEATVSINTDETDVFRLTAQAVDITGFSLSGSPRIWDILVVEIDSAAATDITISWGASFSDGNVFKLPTTVEASKGIKVALNYDGTKWVAIGLA